MTAQGIEPIKYPIISTAIVSILSINTLYGKEHVVETISGEIPGLLGYLGQLLIFR